MSIPTPNNTVAQQPLKADFLMLLVTLLAAAGWMFSKEALAGLPPLLFIGIRFFLAGVVLAAACGPTLISMPWALWRQALMVGCTFSAAMLFWIHGLFYGTHIGEGAFITSLGVVLIPIFSRWIFNEKPPLSTWLALPVAVAGFGFLSLRGGFSLEKGQFFFLMAALIFAVHFNLNTRVVAKIPAIALTAIQLTVVGIVAFCLSAATEPWPVAVKLSIWGWLLASALIATAMRFFIQTYAQGLTPASHAAVILTIEPVWTALLAGLWFGEGMTHTQIIGCSLIFTALLVNRWKWVKLAFTSIFRHRSA